MKTLKFLFNRYFIEALGSMAYGLFASLIIGLIISQLAKIPGLDFLDILGSTLSAQSPVVGAAIGVAIAYGLKTPQLVLFSSAATGALGYVAGGPVGAFISSLIGAELGSLISKRTPIDIVLTPMITIISGALVGAFVGPFMQEVMLSFGSLINQSTELNPFLMGIAVSLLVGVALTLPISSAAICIMLEIDGLAAGAATVGCCAQMIGFAVTSYRDNGIGGLLSQGLGTSMLQIPNIVRRPQVWIAPTFTSMVLGPLSTIVFQMTNSSIGAGMGTSGLVGQIATFATMSAKGVDTIQIVVSIIILHFILPATIALFVDSLLRKAGIVRNGDLKIG
ncbi:MAG: PTS transporter subunit IIC [Bacteroidales bacterium]